MITITYSNLLLTVLTLCAVVVTGAIVVLAVRARTTLVRLDRLMARTEAVLPDVVRLADEAEQAVRSVHRVADHAGGVARDVESVTAEMRGVALPLLEELREQVSLVRGGLRHASALIVGARAGLAALARARS